MNIPTVSKQQLSALRNEYFSASVAKYPDFQESEIDEDISRFIDGQFRGPKMKTFQTAMMFLDRIVTYNTVTSHQISPETSEWGGFLSGNLVNDDRKGKEVAFKICKNLGLEELMERLA